MPCFLKIKLSFALHLFSPLPPPYTYKLPHTSQETFGLLQDILWDPVVIASCHINFSNSLQRSLY